MQFDTTPTSSNRFANVPQPGLNFDHGWTARRIHCPASWNDFPQFVAHLFRLASPKGGIRYEFMLDGKEVLMCASDKASLSVVDRFW